MKERSKKEPTEEERKKVIEIYNNYGIDVSEMEDDEIGRIIKNYRKRPGLLSSDLELSKKYANKSQDNK